MIRPISQGNRGDFRLILSADSDRTSTTRSDRRPQAEVSQQRSWPRTQLPVAALFDARHSEREVNRQRKLAAHPTPRRRSLRCTAPRTSGDPAARADRAPNCPSARSSAHRNQQRVMSLQRKPDNSEFRRQRAFRRNKSKRGASRVGESSTRRRSAQRPAPLRAVSLDETGTFAAAILLNSSPARPKA